jgi:Bacterial Ig-like domain (group 3)/FG-GAP-like repeat/FG-GAP repeat
MTSTRTLTARILKTFPLILAALAVLTTLATTAAAQNPVPFVDQPLVPDATAPGGAAFTLTVNGAGFVPASVVKWNGSPRATTFVSSSQLTAKILASDIAKASTASVKVFNPSPGGGVSNTQFFSIAVAEASASFLPAEGYGSGGAYSYSMAVADVNGDGKPDLVVVSCGPGTACGGGIDGVVGVLLGNGNGTFQPAVTYDAGGSQTAAIAVADLNGDGKLDLVVANSYYSNTVGVLLGNGDGTFQTVVTYGSGGGYPGSVAVADVNGDGKPDILVANQSSCYGCTDSGLVGVLLGNGDGTFQPAVTYSSGGYNLYNSLALAVADLNGDGKLDVAVTNACGVDGDCYGNGSLGVLLGNGDGTFQPAVNYGSGGVAPVSLAIADVNQDGKQDLLAANSSCPSGSTCEQGTIGVLLGNGDGTFLPAVLYGTGADDADSLAVGDVNADGKLDLVVVNFCSSSGCPIPSPGSVGVLLGNGNGTFQPVTTYSSGGYWGAFSPAVADVTGDGRPDLFVVNLFGEPSDGSVGVLLNNTRASRCVGKCVTSTALTSSLDPSIYGQKVTWTATVTTSGPVPPTGKINFSWNGYSIGTATLNASGVATLTRSALNADTYPLIAVYGGDANNLASTSSVLNQVVTETKSSAALTSSPNPSTADQPVTFTATIKSPTVAATGPVTFTAGKTVLGTAQLANGKATFTISTLAVGTTTVTANYYGDSNISGSAASVKQTVGSAASLIEDDGKLPVGSKTTRSTRAGGCYSSTTLTTNGSPALIGNQIVFTASVLAAGYCNNQPQGDCYEPITFYDGNTVIGSVPLNRACIATFADILLTAKTHKIKAYFPGTGDGDPPSYSKAVTQVVTGYPTATTLTSSLTPSVYGQSVTWTATVTSPSPYGYLTIPTEKVEFTWGGVYTIGTALLNASGVATLTKSNLNADSYPLTATYVGDPNNAGSTSAPLAQVVTQTTSAATLTSSPNPSTEGQAATFLATITSPTIAATGPVTFSTGNTVLGTAELVDGKARFTTSTLPVRANPVTVNYYGDSNIAGSSASITETVQP